MPEDAIPFEPVLFNASVGEHTSTGNPDLVAYSENKSNDGSWDGACFAAPADGWYQFSLSFVREARDQYTADDVFVYLTIDGSNFGRAWCGQAPISRSTGTCTIVWPVKERQENRTFASSGGEPPSPRLIRNVQFCGVRVA